MRIVVCSLEKEILRWERMFGYRRSLDIVTNTRQKVRVAFLSKDGSIFVKLVEPNGNGSPVSLFARRGGGLPHLCFRCDKLETQIPILVQKGARCIVQPEPGEVFENNKRAFLFNGSNLNFEVIDATAPKHY
jgi:methylmalonyl-CoA/ethylmalonyl-CoA epimerase